MSNGCARFTYHDWADVPTDQWGKPFRHPHHLSDGRTGFTPHQAAITAAYVLVGDQAYPIERDVCRVVAFDATHVTLVIGPDAPSTVLRDVLTKKLKVVPTALRVAVWTRFVPSFELGRHSVADATVETKFKVGLPISLMEEN